MLERLEAAASATAKGPHRFDTRRWARALAAQCRAILEEIAFLGSDEFKGIPTLREVAALAGDLPQTMHARERIAAAESLSMQAVEFAQMEYDFLFDRARQLVTIGYNVTEHRAEQSYYDLLASEARLGSFVAIAQGHVPQDNWFAMGRCWWPPAANPCCSGRQHVRVPDAAGGDADIREHAARSDI
jgi:hypothetical protein